jgi:hypothetical protein
MKYLYKTLSIILLTFILFTPFALYALDPDIGGSITIGVGSGDPNVFTIGAIFLGIFNIVVVVLIALALVYFIYGVVKFLHAQDSDTERTAARNQMVWGIVALFVIISVWGLVNVLDATFNLRDTTPNTPNVPGTSVSGSSLIDKLIQDVLRGI